MPNIQTTAELLSEIHALRNALLDANGLCRSAFQVANRLATELGTHALQTSFGAMADRFHESLQRQHKVILDTGGYVLAEAQPAPKAVAYLDLGVGGYTDIGTDLTDEELATLPKGRHMLGVIGTYGVDGYVSAQPTPSVPAGWLRAVDEALVVTHLGVANADDSYEDAKRKLNELICWHVAVATDPAVNGGFKLVPADEQPAPRMPTSVITDYLVSISAHVAHQDDHKAQAEIGELLRMLATEPSVPEDKP